MQVRAAKSGKMACNTDNGSLFANIQFLRVNDRKPNRPNSASICFALQS